MSRKEQTGGWMETAKTVVYAVLIAIVARTFAFEPFSIPSGSMIPTLLVGDYLFVSKYSYGYSRHSFPLSLAPFSGRIFGRQPQRGDVAVFKWPYDNRTDYIKRIVGIENDEVQVRGGVIHVNGRPVELQRQEQPGRRNDGFEPLLYVETFPDGTPHVIRKRTPIVPNTPPCDETQKDPTNRCHPDNTKMYKVPKDHVFVMGDNRDESSDSRLPDSRFEFVPVENLVGRAEFIFFSTDGSAALWEVWKWPGAIRFSRIFNGIR